MQILESIYRSLRIIGLNSHQSIQKCPFNARNLISLLTFGLNLTCDIGVVIYGAKDLLECFDAIYLSFTILSAASIFINLVTKMPQLFEFLNSLEVTVTQSKL